MRKAIFDVNMLFFWYPLLNNPVASAEEETEAWFPFSGNSILLSLSAHDVLKTAVYLIAAT